MSTIVAIGGGELRDLETLAIDRRIVELSGKSKPNALFIPTASGDSEDYQQVFHNVYGKKLGCNTNVLTLISNLPSSQEIADKIRWCDLVYVGGGNTLRMMRLWRKRGVDKLLLEAYERGVVMSGLSAGGICWFRYGHSDSLHAFDNSKPYIRVKGLGLLPATFCPHYLWEQRNENFPQMIAKYGGIGIALDNFCAIEFNDGSYSIIRSRESAAAYRLTRKKGAAMAGLINESGITSDLFAINRKKE